MTVNRLLINDKKLTVACLKRYDFVQEAPRVRTVMALDGMIRLSFPWVSFAVYAPEMIASHILVFFHNEPWRDMDHAFEIFGGAPHVFHGMTNGLCCIGPVAGTKVYHNQMTPSEAFWNTASEFTISEFHLRSKYVPVMCDLVNPKRVLDETWPDVDYRWMPIYWDAYDNKRRGRR